MDLPIENGDSNHSYVTNYQMVYIYIIFTYYLDNILLLGISTIDGPFLYVSHYQRVSAEWPTALDVAMGPVAHRPHLTCSKSLAAMTARDLKWCHDGDTVASMCNENMATV